MIQSRNQFNEDERVYATVYDSTGMITASTSVLLTIIRDYDNFIFDFSDAQFKASGWTTSSQPMTELDSTSSPGVYYYDWDVANIGTMASQRNYFIQATHPTASNSPQEGYLKLGGWIDQVNLGGMGTPGKGGMTSAQAADIAEKVWKVILEGEMTAKDILLSKSEFDATKDYVLYTRDDEMYTNLQKLKDEIKKIKFPDNSDKIIRALDRLKPIDFNPILEKVLDKISLTVSFFETGKNDIIKSVEGQEKYDDNEIKTLIAELKTTISLLQEDIGERIDVAKTISEEIAAKGEKIGEGHQEKMHEMISKLETESENNCKNIKKILLKMTELKFDSDNSNLNDFSHIQDQLELILDYLEGK